MKKVLSHRFDEFYDVEILNRVAVRFPGVSAGLTGEARSVAGYGANIALSLNDSDNRPGDEFPAPLLFGKSCMAMSFDRRDLMRMLTSTLAGTAVVSRIAFAEDQTSKGPQPVFIEAGKGKTGKFGGVEIAFKLDSAQTWGKLGSTELTLAPGFMGTPPHYHRYFEEVTRVLEGTVTVMVGDTTYEVGAGGWHLRPRGMVHSFWNSGKTPAKMIELYLPGGHEDYMKELAMLFEDDKHPTHEQIAVLGEKNDIHWEWAKLPEIMDKYKVKL